MRVVLCRFGELFLKLGNRASFQRRLRDNAQRMLTGLSGARVEAPHGRLLVHVDEDELPEALARLARVFGLVSLSPAEVVPADLDEIMRAAVRAAQTRPAPSFKIEARRSDKRFPLPSPEIARRVGARVVEATGFRVDVHQPALRIGIEVGPREAYVFGGTEPGPGGLPAGSAGRALLLLSGGIDSPVAGWLAAKRGLALGAVYFHSPPYVGEKSKDKVIALSRLLGRWQALDSLHVVQFTDLQKRLRAAGPAELAVVLYRRMMMRVADLLAARHGASALVTGENLGQVASQTLQNLSVIGGAARPLVLRPLLTYDKVETTTLARRIGTYETSILPFEDCCSLFVPAHPVTAARSSEVDRAEARLDMGAEAEAAASTAELHPIG